MEQPIAANQNDKTWRKRLRVFVVVACLVLSGPLGLFGWMWWHDPMRWIERHATNIHDERINAGWTGDFLRRMRFDCSEELFRSFVFKQRIDFRINIDGAYQKWNTSNAPSWWDPPQYGTVYLQAPGNGGLRMVCYRNGTVYYESSQW